jgi:hypothetical protein
MEASAVGVTRHVARLAALARRAAFAPRAQLDALRIQVGALHARWIEQLGPDELERSEFQVFSQFGEDGIVQFLVQRVPVENHMFVELGVEDYSESNTRFLLINNGWRGLIVDASSAHRRFLEVSGLMWRTTIDAVTAFVNRDNVDKLIRSSGVTGDIGLLSIDIDGNDLWILEAIESVSPRVIIAEYNSLFGPDHVVSVPYDPNFVRSEKHFSNLYWGASLAAVTRLAAGKGYALVGSNRSGNNAFFVRRDVLGEIPERSAAVSWRRAQYRDSRSREGDLTFLSDDREKLRVIRDRPLVDFASDGRERLISELYDV